jgi:hypothetical protein
MQCVRNAAQQWGDDLRIDLLAAKHFEIDHSCEPFQRIARRRQCFRPLIAVEKSRLPRHCRAPSSPTPAISHFPSKRQRFFEAS